MEDIQSYLAHNCSSFLIPSITWSGKAATIICMTSTKGTISFLSTRGQKRKRQMAERKKRERRKMARNNRNVERILEKNAQRRLFLRQTSRRSAINGERLGLQEG